MVSVDMGNCTLRFDGYLKTHLDYLKELPPNDWDVVGLCGGYEGSGKTTLFMQIAYYLDNSFSLDKIVFNIDQFNKAVDEAEVGSCIMYDEADDAAVGANWQHTKVKAIISKMKRIRKKRLFILFVTPTLFDIGKYFAIHRTRFFIHVYSKGTTRGYFRFYDREAKKLLYFKGKQYWDMNAQKSSFYGGFTKLPDGFPIDMSAYEQKKDEATKEIGSVEVDKLALYKDDLVKRLIVEEKLLEKDKARIFGVSVRHFRLLKAKSLENQRAEVNRSFLINNTGVGGSDS